MQRVFLIHGWTGRPEGDWRQWAKEELQKIGYDVIIPVLPNPDNPKIEEWIDKIKESVGETRPDDIFVGHSLGCMAILLYLQTLPEDKKVNKVILVAGFERLTEVAMDNPVEDYKIMNPWYQATMDYGKVKNKAKSFIALFSDDDSLVSYEDNYKVYEKGLGAKVILVKGMGHFSEESGITKLPILLKLVQGQKI